MPELPKHEFSLQFERDQEEKEGHQSVVDPLLYRPNGFTRTNLNPDRDLPDTEECVSPGRVRQEKSHERRREENSTRRRFDLHES